ncbi:MAG TPA: signal recognition particle protein, partial [Oscillospiraceae bacterium]|nr:signal recognition particle protein [Oscillospiraceae bacterium]
LSARAVTGKPIKFVGVGEKLADLEDFHPDRMASRILGMGDVLSLIEKAETALDEKKALELQEKIRRNRLDFNDLYDQISQVRKMGSVKDTLSMIPGLSKKIEDVDIDERKFDRVQAIILSMTPEEREKPEIMNPSRKRRIAAGCGQEVEDVNRLINQLKNMQAMLKQFSGKGGKNKFRKMAMKGRTGNFDFM